MIAVIGASGQLATSILQTFRRHTKVFAVCRPTSRLQICSDNIDVDYYQLPKSPTSLWPTNGQLIKKLKALSFKHNQDVIQPTLINCMAFHDAASCETRPTMAKLLNEDAAGYWRDVAKELGWRYLYFSTEQVFGRHRGGCSTQHSPMPNNVYGITKAAGEFETLQYENSIVARVSGLFSWYNCVGKPRPNFVRNVISLLRKQDVHLPDQNAYCTLTSTDHVAEALLELLSVKDLQLPLTVHLCNDYGAAPTWYDAGRCIAEEIKKHRNYKHDVYARQTAKDDFVGTYLLPSAWPVLPLAEKSIREFIQYGIAQRFC